MSTIVIPGNDPTAPTFNNFLNTVNRLGLSKPISFKIDSIESPPRDENGNFLQLPGGDGSGAELLITGISLPTRKINSTLVPYKAFEFVVPTNAVYPENQNWSITVKQDSQLKIRDYFEKWSNIMYNINTGIKTFSNTNIQFSITNPRTSAETPNRKISDPRGPNSAQNRTVFDVVRTYKLWGVFPSVIGGVQYSFEDPGTTFASFNVTFSYQYFTIETSQTRGPQVPYDAKAIMEPDRKYPINPPAGPGPDGNGRLTGDF